MSKLFQDDLIKNFPDCYDKTTTSNNYKLLQLIGNTDQKTNIDEVYDILDLDNAYGKTLDYYGKTYNVPRGDSDDDKYRVLIKTRIALSLCKGDLNSVANAICIAMDLQPENIHIDDSDDMCRITLHISEELIARLIETGVSINEFIKLVKSIIPVAITLAPYLFDGTFQFSGVEDEYNENRGFNTAEGGTMGGYLGWVGSE